MLYSFLTWCWIHHHHFSTCLFLFFQHAFCFCSNLNLLDSSSPFFNMSFYFTTYIWTCWMQIHVFQHTCFHSHMQWWISTCITDNVNLFCSSSHTYLCNQSFWISTCMSMFKLASWNPHGEGVMISLEDGFVQREGQVYWVGKSWV